MGRAKRDIFTGIEIGTGSVKVAMAEFEEDDGLRVRGLGQESVPLHKVVKGEVADAEAVVELLARACSAAEKMAGRHLGRMFLAVTGSHIKSMNNPGRVRVARQDRQITDDDVIAANANARDFPLPIGKQLINHWDRRYLVDDCRETLNPIGLIGDLVEAEIHIVYGQTNNIMTSSQLVADLINQAPSALFYSGIASGYSLFTPAQMQRGVLVVDLGAGVTEYVVFHGPGVFHSGQITVGCQQIVNDLSLGLQLPYAKCQKILNALGEYGSAIMRLDSKRCLEVEALGQAPRRLPCSTIETIVELRLRELFELIRDELREQGAWSRLGVGAVLTGGGALIPQIDKLAQQVFSAPVAVGVPRQVKTDAGGTLDPRWATPLGLIRLGAFALDIESYQPSLWQLVGGDLKKAKDLIARAFRW